MESIPKRPVSIDDFEVIRLLGKGEYGKVLLVQKKHSTDLFAMKILKKKHIKEKRQVQHTLSERSVLTKARHPFIVQLHYAFQTPQKLYFVLEYCPGGELYFHISKFKRFPEDRSKFYAACIALSLSYLHSQNIIYRDLKPENIVIDNEGYPKITDFGLSKEGISKDDSTRTVCGTPEYIAPEVILRQGHGQAVDWWSLGCIIYEMLVGLPPFYVDDRREIYKKIIQTNVKIPQAIGINAADIIQKLLVKDPRMRLGAENDGEVLAHPWFSDINWRMLEMKRVSPPFLPDVVNPLEPLFFAEDTGPSPRAEPVLVSGSPNCGTFKGFSYNGSGESMELNI